jgi:aryl-alcohol dehydrogenase-like predicted oxidoreductase
MRVPTTRLGSQGLTVGALGMGAMVLSGTYGQPDRGESETAFERAVELGVTLVDTADLYGDGENERFLAPLLARHRHELVLATKFGFRRSPAGDLTRHGRPGYARQAVDESLRRLGTDHVDLYYLHRVDPQVPVEETVGAMAGLVAAGKVRYLGVCAVTAEQLRRANAVHPISAVQSEWSLCQRAIEASVLPAAREQGKSGTQPRRARVLACVRRVPRRCTRPDRARLAVGAGTGRRPDPRNRAHRVARAERGGAGDPALRRGGR